MDLNPLAGKPLRYLIGAEVDDLALVEGRDGVITVVPYDAMRPPARGIGVKYGNLFDETNSGQLGPYRKDTDTAELYGEGVIDHTGIGWHKNLAQQCARAKAGPFAILELDNADAYPVSAVIGAINKTADAGLGVLAKNPGLMDGDATPIVARPNIFGIVVEKDGGTPAQMHALRVAAGKPDLPVWFVFFGDGRAAAEATAFEIRRGGLVNMSVTLDRTAKEYGGDVEDILLPIQAAPSVSPTQTKRTSMAWRPAKCLDTLLNQVNALAPNRDKSSDGTIGDAAHAATKSEHNPDENGVVRARDITHDPAHGVDGRRIAEAMVASRDPRILYIISNAEIISSVKSPWVWRPYGGTNAHRQHVHISVVENPALYDDTRAWQIAAAFGRDQSSPTPASAGLQSGKGSWYSQYSGKYEWIDTGDEPGSAALTGTPDDAQGISFYDRSTLGSWFEVHAPNGFISIEQQTDIGPNPKTGRTIDIAAAAAERMGYTPRNFPTDSIFSWRPVVVPAVVAGLPPVQQAIRYRDLRRTEPVIPSPQPSGKPMAPAPTIFNPRAEEFLSDIRPIAERYIQCSAAGPADALTAYLVSRGWVPPTKDVTPAPGTTEQAAPIATPAPAAPSTASTVATNLGVGAAGALAAGLAAFFGGVSIPTAVGAGGAAGIAGLLGGYAPIVNGVLNAVSAFRAGRAAQKAKAAP